MSTNINTSAIIFTACNTFGYANLSGLSTLNLSGAVFATTNMTMNGDDVHTASDTFRNASFFRLIELDLNGIQLGNKNDGTNTIESDCFISIDRNTNWSSSKLQINDIQNY
jgi:hypothetical protein